MNKPESYPRWNLWPSVFLALGGAIAGGVAGAMTGGLLGAMAGSDGFASIMLIGVLSPVGALAGFAYAMLAAVRRHIDGDRRRPTEAEQPVPTVRPERPVPVPSETSSAEKVPAAAPAAPATLKPSPPPRPPARSGPVPPSALEKYLSEAWNWFRRGNPIARTGIVILFIGGAFLVRYAAEHGAFPVEVRLAGIAAGAIVLLGLGWWLRRRRPGYALTLQGGGIAILYLTVYAALRLYTLMPPGAALALMMVIALAAAVLAVAQNSLALAVIGFAGGFAAPLLASSGGGNHIALFGYYAALNLGVFTVAWFRAWRVLNLVGFAFTFGVSALWRGYGYQEAHWLSTDVFLLLFFVLYVAVSVLFALRQPPRLKGYVSGTLVFGLPVVAFALHASVISHIEYALAWSALAFGVFYLGLAAVLLAARRDNLRVLAQAFAALGVIFGSLAVPLAFGPETTAAIWAVEGAGLLWLGIRQQRRLARWFGALLQLGAGIHFLYSMQSPLGAIPVVNSGFMAGAGLAVAAFLSSWWLERARGNFGTPARWIFLLWGLLWWLVAGVNDIGRFAPHAIDFGLALTFLALTAWLLDFLGRAGAWTAAARLAPFYAALMLTGSTIAVAALTHPLARGAWFGWPLMWLVFYWLLYRRDRPGDTRLPRVTGWLHALGVWSLAAVTILEARWQIARQVEGTWSLLVPGLVSAAAAWLCACAPAIWPWSRHRPVYRFRAAVPLTLLAAGWLAWINLTGDGDPGALPYLPLLNPLDVAAMLVLLALAGWWMALIANERTRLSLAPALAAALVFLWLSAALIRALHYLAGTPLDWEGISASVTVQMALSIFWALLGFAVMVLASRRRHRIAWMTGAGLMGVVVVKLFLVDLAGSETLARVVSFLSVGAVMLVAGYFSPLPPKAETEPS